MRALIALVFSLFMAAAHAAEYKTIAVKLRYLDAGGTSVSDVAGASSTVAKFWTANSGGRITFPTTVHPVVLTIPKNKPVTTYCDWTFMGDAYNAIRAAVDLSLYQRAIVVMPMQTSCPYKGFQSQLANGILASFTSSTNVQYIAHELGHSVNLGHANAFTCKSPAGAPEPLNLTKCWSMGEYSGDYDVMGKRLLGSNAPHRAKLGLMQPIVHPGGEATYVLPPVGANPLAQNAVKVPLANGRALWIEYRQPLGADAGFPSANTLGALVWATGTWGGSTSSAWCSDYSPCRVDMQASGTYHTGHVLLPGTSYSNAALGLTITAVDRTDEKLTVTVKN